MNKLTLKRIREELQSSKIDHTVLYDRAGVSGKLDAFNLFKLWLASKPEGQEALNALLDFEKTAMR